MSNCHRKRKKPIKGTNKTKMVLFMPIFRVLTKKSKEYDEKDTTRRNHYIGPEYDSDCRRER